MKTFALIFAVCVVASAIEPRKSVQDYPAHIELPAADIGVEYLIHSYSVDGQMYFTKDYLVVEVAVYPKGPMGLTTGSFALRINNSKNVIQPASAEFVAASLKYSDWNQHPYAQVGAGVGDTGVTIGGPRSTGRFPGDPAGQQRYPKPPQAPADPNKPEKPIKDEAQLVIDNALKTGKITSPATGYVYFGYSGNMKKVKNLSVVVHLDGTDHEIPLR